MLESLAAALDLLCPVTGWTPVLTVWIGDTSPDYIFRVIKGDLAYINIYIHIGTTWHIVLLKEIVHDIWTYF